MKSHLFSFFFRLSSLALFLLLFSCQEPSTLPYSSAKPLTRWWWFASEIQKEDIASQLDWLKAQGFGGVEVAWVYPLNRMKGDTVNITPRQRWLSREWTDVVQYCKQYADSLGLSVDFTFGSLWPFGDELVTPGESTKEFGDSGFRQWIRASWDYPEKGLVIDHLNKNAFETYAARTGKALEPAMQTGNPSGIFVDSWEVETKNLWTTGFDSLFKSRSGYDITPYMEQDILSPQFEGQRYDYMKLLSELVISNFYKPFTTTAHDLGGFSRGQCSGSPTDIISAYASLDVPESEAMLYEPYFTRIVSSAAALSERKIISAETFTCLYGWPREHMRQEKVTDLKLVADALFAHGLNQIIWHGTPYNTNGSDSVSFYATVHVGKAGALSGDLKPFNHYMTAVSEYMRKGIPCSGVAIYVPTEDAWIAGEMPKEKQLPWAWGEYEMRYLEVPEEIRGYQPMWINGKFLKEGVEGERGKGGEGMRVGDCEFRSVYVDVKWLDIEALRSLTELAESGINICLKRLPEEAGYFKHPEFGTLRNKLQSLAFTEWTEAAPGKALVEGSDVPWFWARQDGNTRYIFFAHPLAREFKYPVKYGQADTDQVMIRKITVNVNERSIPVTLEFKPYQSLLLEVKSNGKIRFIDLPDFRSPGAAAAN